MSSDRKRRPAERALPERRRDASVLSHVARKAPQFARRRCDRPRHPSAFGGNSWGNGFDVEGQPAHAGADYSAQIRPVSPGYFAALAIPIRQGNDFTERDNENAPGVAIVNELVAKRFWPDESPLGKRIRYGKDWLSIVGVCGNIKHARLDAESDLEIYVPYPQVPGEVLQFLGRDLNYVVRSTNPAW